MNVLITDDERVIREGIKRTLTGCFPDIDIYLAASPEEAVQVMASVPVDIVLTDVLMPGMSGLELMRLSRHLHPHVKWVVISAHSEFAYAQEAVRLGAKDYLLKPIGKEKLIELVALLAEERKREDELTREGALLKSNLKYLREAVFQRLASGLDTGGFDMQSLIGDFGRFRLILVKLETEHKARLEHFIVENVLGELIETYGRGFAASFDSRSLFGLLACEEADAAGRGRLEPFLSELNVHLSRYVKVPFQIAVSDSLHDVQSVPVAAQLLRNGHGERQNAEEAGRGEGIIDVALQYIRAHYREELSLEKVASVVFLNPVYFSQLFKQKIGQGFKEYIIQLRLERAKVLLRDPRLKLADVAEQIGYQDMRHFTQLFRKRFEQTPTDYRQKLERLQQ